MLAPPSPMIQKDIYAVMMLIWLADTNRSATYFDIEPKFTVLVCLSA